MSDAVVEIDWELQFLGTLVSFGVSLLAIATKADSVLIFCIIIAFCEIIVCGPLGVLVA